MRKFKFIILATILAAVSVSAQETLDPTIGLILGHSTEAAALRARLDAEISASHQLNNLSDPSIEFEHQWGQDGAGNKWGLGISQGFDWPGAYKARSKVATATRTAAISSYDAAINDLQLRITILLIDLSYANQELQLLDSIKASLFELKGKYQRSYEQGEATILDVKKIEIENLNIMRQRNSVADRRTSIIGELSGISPNAPWESIISKIDYPRVGAIMSEEFYANTIYENDPQTRNFNDMLSLASNTINAEKKSNLPGFSIGYRHNFEIADHFNGFNIGITLPLFSSRGKVKAAEADAIAIEAQATAYRSSIEAEWRTLREQAIRLESENAHYASILNSSDSGRLLRIALDGGEISLLEYLQEIAYFQQANRDYLALKHEYITTIARLNSYIY